jgi:Na+/proline symporter
MLSARTEKGAIAATLFFNVAHYALRPWPWIIVSLASIIVFPDLASIRSAFPNVAPGLVQNDFAYPAMLSFLPSGFLGIVVASLIAAFMSTISTQVNWGSSYVVNDFYQRFINPQATDKQLVAVGRWSTVLLMVLTFLFALVLKNALQAFAILLQVGAGTGLIFILRWFWWRINSYSEISAMVISFILAVYLEIVHPLTGLPALSVTAKLLIGVGITTVGWLIVTLVTRPTDTATLRNFYRLIQPGGPGWAKVVKDARRDNDPVESKHVQGWDVPAGILCMVLGTLAVYGALFAVGNFIYGNHLLAFSLTAGVIIASFLLLRVWSKMSVKDEVEQPY